MEQLKALDILKKTRAQLEDDHKFAQMYDEAIAELEALQALKTCETCKYSGYFSPHDSLECLNNDCNFYSCDVDLNDGCNKHEAKDTL